MALALGLKNILILFYYCSHLDAQLNLLQMLQ